MAPKSKKQIEIQIRPRGQAQNKQRSAATTSINATTSTYPTYVFPNLSFELDTTWTSAFIGILKSYSTVLVTGPTGCGKSTQVPIAIRYAFPDARTLLVQPRRLATERLAHYIASLLDTTVGEGVGFFMGRCNISDNRTPLLIATAGSAFNRIVSRPDEFDFIILDEIHEESPQLEQLKAICKIAQQRYNFKLVLMSATKDPLVLRTIFPNFYHFKIKNAEFSAQKGNFPVKEFYADMNEKGKTKTGRHNNLKMTTIMRDAQSPAIFNHRPYLKAAASILLKILSNWERGDIIVFLPGVAAITDFITLFDNVLTSWANTRRVNKPTHNTLVVHSMCSEEYKLDSLTAMSKNQTIPNILLATNLCETSLTLPTLYYVVDTGLTRQFTLQSGKKKLVTTLTSIESMIQRKGRVGRVGPGEYHSVIHMDAFQYLSPCYAKDTELDSLPYLILLSFLGTTSSEEKGESSGSILSSLISELLLTSNRFTAMDVFYILRSLLASSLVIQYDTTISSRKDHPIQLTHEYFAQYYRCSADDLNTSEKLENLSEDKEQSSVELEGQSDSMSTDDSIEDTHDKLKPDEIHCTNVLPLETIAMIKNAKHYGVSARAILPLIMKYSLDKALSYYWYFMLGLPYTGMAAFSFNAINHSIFISDLEMRLSKSKLKNSVTNRALLLLAAIVHPSFFIEFQDRVSFYFHLMSRDSPSEGYDQEYFDSIAAATLLQTNPSMYTLDGCSDGAASAIILALWRKRFPVPTEHPTPEEARWCLVRCLSPYFLRQLELEIISCRSKLAKVGLLSEPSSHEQLLLETIYPLTNTELVSALQSYGYCYNENNSDHNYHDGNNSKECWEKCAKDKGCTTSTLSVILREVEHYDKAYFQLCALADILTAIDKPGSEIAAYFDMRHKAIFQPIFKKLNSVLERLLKKSIYLKDFTEHHASYHFSFNGLTEKHDLIDKITINPANYSIISVNLCGVPPKAIAVNLGNVNNILRRPWEPIYNYCSYHSLVSLDLVASKHTTNFQSLTFDQTGSLICYLSVPSGSLMAGMPSVGCQTKLTNGAYLHNGPLITLLLYTIVNDYVDCVFYQSKKNPLTFVFELCRFGQHFYRLYLDTIEKQDTFCSIFIAISLILKRYIAALCIFNETGERKPPTDRHKYLTDPDLVEQLSGIFGRDIQLSSFVKSFTECLENDTSMSPILCFNKAVLEFIKIPLNDDTPYIPGLLGLIELVDLNEYKLLSTIRTFEYQRGTSSIVNV
ncbi:ATP-dependent RNA helicase A [Giardia lamblia P15]|uniref:ATP-dependent RNA helicase A n=1 Tax=Giardia intestinalis (strain P15) TaxID=658858 RepID=E1F8I1_GIAIA|nr:ATP-dependent RNA helicase A [Giardia lamblia P15]